MSRGLWKRVYVGECIAEVVIDFYWPGYDRLLRRSIHRSVRYSALKNPIDIHFVLVTFNYEHNAFPKKDVYVT